MYIKFSPEEKQKLAKIHDSYYPKLTKIENELSNHRKDPNEEVSKKAHEDLLLRHQALLDKMELDYEKFYKKTQQDHFKPIKEAGTAAIIENAREQAPMILDEFYNTFCKTAGGEGLEQLGIGRQEGNTLLVNASFISDTLRTELRLHINALENDKAAQDEVFKIIVNAIKNCRYAINDKYNKPALSAIPNGESVAFLSKILNMKGGRMILEAGKNRHNAIKSLIHDDKNMLWYISKNEEKGTSIEVTITQADKYLRKSRKGTGKLLIYVLQSMAEQHYPSVIRLFLNNLVDDGLYSTTSNAKRGIIDFFEQQKLITLKGQVKKGRQTVVEEGGILFYSYRFDKGKGVIDLQMNENFNIDFIANYFSLFPRFAYGLNTNAFSLVWYIFYIARQRARDIKDNGKFNINLDTIRENLGLPCVNDVKNRKYKQFIIDPIETAIEEIEAALENVPEAQNRAFTITPIIPENANIREWLTGYLEIGLADDFADTFIEISTKAETERKKWEHMKMTQQAKLEVQKNKK